MTMTHGAGEPFDAALGEETPDGKTAAARDRLKALEALAQLWNTPSRAWAPDSGALDEERRDGRPRMGVDTPQRPGH